MRKYIVIAKYSSSSHCGVLPVGRWCSSVLLDLKVAIWVALSEKSWEEVTQDAFKSSFVAHRLPLFFTLAMKVTMARAFCISYNHTDSWCLLFLYVLNNLQLLIPAHSSGGLSLLIAICYFHIWGGLQISGSYLPYLPFCFFFAPQGGNLVAYFPLVFRVLQSGDYCPL